VVYRAWVETALALRSKNSHFPVCTCFQESLIHASTSLLTVHPLPVRAPTIANRYKLANDKQDTRAIQLYMGHKNIQHIVRYTALAAGRFQDFWRDEDYAGREPSIPVPNPALRCMHAQRTALASASCLPSSSWPCLVTHHGGAHHDRRHRASSAC